MQGAAVHKSHEGRSQVNLTVGHLLQAVDKFDLSHHPPVADKASHVSNQERSHELFPSCLLRTFRMHEHTFLPTAERRHYTARKGAE